MRVTLDNRLTRAILLGVIVSLISSAVVGFNVKTSSIVEVSDQMNRYYDTCLREALTPATPRITTTDRGFPLAHYTRIAIPVCENGAALKTYQENRFNALALLMNIFFWATVLYLLLGRLHRRSMPLETSSDELEAPA